MYHMAIGQGGHSEVNEWLVWVCNVSPEPGTQQMPEECSLNPIGTRKRVC